MPIGVTMMALGGVLAVLAAWRFRDTRLPPDEKHLEEDGRRLVYKRAR